MTNPESENLWGEPNKWHTHTCRKCGQTDECAGRDCPIRELDYLCGSCLVGQFGGK
jgi:hypothetical protein